MSLPPVDKLPLAVRKNVRDEWEANKPDLEKQMSDLLGEQWIIEANPNAIWPYHNDGYAKDSLGSCIKAYVEGALWRLKSIVSDHGSEVAKEINTICHARILTLEYDDTTSKRFSYGGGDVVDGKLRLLFVKDCLGTNIDYCLEERVLLDALNNAATPPSGEQPMSLITRTFIRQKWDPEYAAIQTKFAEMLQKPDFKLNPNFEDSYKKLAAAAKAKGSQVREDWESNLGGFTLQYFDGALYQMNSEKFGEDDMLQEGFNDAVEKAEMAFRIVDKLKYDSYCECEIEDGVLYLQTTPEKWATNIHYVAQKLMDLL